MSRKPRLSRLLRRTLTKVQRRILYMHIEQRKSFRQIQKELGYKAVSTVFQHYRYALAKARAQVNTPPVPEATPTSL